MHCLFVWEKDVDALCDRCDVGHGYVRVYHIYIGVCEEVVCCSGISEDRGACVGIVLFLVPSCSSILAVICNGWENSGGTVNFVG